MLIQLGINTFDLKKRKTAWTTTKWGNYSERRKCKQNGYTIKKGDLTEKEVTTMGTRGH